MTPAGEESSAGTVYLTDGSHGCVNTPPAAMKVIFETMDSGTPVVAVLLRKSKMPGQRAVGREKEEEMKNESCL